MVVEASSEGLAQGRLEGCVFDVALFTNLTRDHLDFHGTMEAYRDAKGLLFEMLDRPTTRASTAPPSSTPTTRLRVTSQRARGRREC